MKTFFDGSQVHRGLRAELPHKNWNAAWIGYAACAGVAVILGGCSGHSQGGALNGGSVGQFLNQPDASISSLSPQFIVDANSGGHATNLHVIDVRWGRLVDIYDSVHPTPQQHDYVIREDIVSSSRYTLSVNPVTDAATLKIKFPVGSADYLSVFTNELDYQFLPIVQDKSLDPNQLPPFPLIPRNAAIVVTFDDLLATSAINSQTIQVFQGYPPNVPFEARIIRDINHGDLGDFDGVAGLEFYTTRVIIDTTVSQTEAGQSNPPLNVNELGFPGSITQNQPNVAIRIPTQTDTSIGQVAILRNPTGHTVAQTGNGSIDTSSSTHDLVRAARSGGSVTLDENNGFLLNPFKPSLLGAFPVFIDTVSGSGDILSCNLRFAYIACVSGLREGDVIQQGDAFFEVVCPPGQDCPANSVVTQPAVGQALSNVYFRLVPPLVGSLSAGTTAQVYVRFDPVIHAGKEQCFLTFPDIGAPPNQAVRPDSPIILRFSEPMDPATVTPFDSFTITNTATSPAAYNQFAVGNITHTTDLRQFSFVPSVPLKHIPPPTGPATGETYFVNLASGVHGPTDLSGNVLDNPLPQVSFRLDPSASIQNTASFALRMDSNNMVPDAGNKPELRGQFLLDFDRGVIKPRPVTHYHGIADRTQAVPGIMPPFAAGVQTPVSKLGSKMQSLWRYCDVGFALFDEQNINVDVEGLNWAPTGGSVVADHITRFEISLCHSLHLPDESPNPANNFPLYPSSGLVSTYAQNVLDPAHDPQRTVYPVPQGPQGYSIVPTDAFNTTTNTFMLPWPLNRGSAVSSFAYYTWRDTSIQAKGAPTDSPGADLPIIGFANGTPGVPAVSYTTGTVPTIGLALLMEFRCYPDNGASGLNSFDVSIAIGSSSIPNFRAFSTGGTNTSNQPVPKNPDSQPVATGGFNPSSMPTPGAPTAGTDNTFYIGMMDLVVRVSRVHSIWFNTGSATVIYAPPVVAPLPSDQPTGTSVTLAFRGASSVLNAPLLADATKIDAYGDVGLLTGGSQPVFLNNDNTWKSSLTQLNGAALFQMRITFVSNTESGVSPELSAVGFAYRL